ncbi:protein of unknown function [Burkholderia multivorans]
MPDVMHRFFSPSSVPVHASCTAATAECRQAEPAAGVTRDELIRTIVMVVRRVMGPSVAGHHERKFFVRITLVVKRKRAESVRRRRLIPFSKGGSWPQIGTATLVG